MAYGLCLALKSAANQHETFWFRVFSGSVSPAPQIAFPTLPARQRGEITIPKTSTNGTCSSVISITSKSWVRDQCTQLERLSAVWCYFQTCQIRNVLSRRSTYRTAMAEIFNVQLPATSFSKSLILLGTPQLHLSSYTLLLRHPLHILPTVETPDPLSLF